MIYEFSEETVHDLNLFFLKNFGMGYKEFIALDYTEQQRLIDKLPTKKNKKESKVRVMIGSGVQAFFTKVNRGKRIMIGTGSHAIFIKAGEMSTKSNDTVDQRLEAITSNNPQNYIKRLTRKIKSKIFY